MSNQQQQLFTDQEHQSAAEKVQVAPGCYVPGGERQLPRVALVDWIGQSDGSFKPRIRMTGRRVRLSEKNLKDLNLGVEYRTMLRLIKAGFIEGEKIAPNCWTFCLESFLGHREDCQDDPDFWEEENPDENRKRYRESYTA